MDWCSAELFRAAWRRGVELFRAELCDAERMVQSSVMQRRVVEVVQNAFVESWVVKSVPLCKAQCVQVEPNREKVVCADPSCAERRCAKFGGAELCRANACRA